MARQHRSTLGDVSGGVDPFAEVSWRELRGLLDEELNRLPAKLHTPLILCHLESRTRDEAAKSLGWSLRTLDRRLARGREVLKARLVRRGVGTLGLGVSVLGGGGITAAVPDRLIEGLCGPVGNAAASVRSLIVSGSRTLSLKITLGLVLVLGGVAAMSGFGGSPPPEKKSEMPTPKVNLADNLEDPMPDGALRRFGSTRYRFPGGNAHAAMTRDGKLVAIGGYGVVLVYETATGKLLHAIDNCGMTNAVGRLSAIAFSPDGKLLAHIVRDGEIVARVWSVETWKELSSVKGLRPTFRTGYIPLGQTKLEETEYDNFTGIHFMDNGKNIALVGERRVHIRDAHTGEKIAIYDVPAVEVPRDGEQAKAGGDVLSPDIPLEKTKVVMATLVALSSDGSLYVSNHGSQWQVGELATKRVLFRTTAKLNIPKGRRWQPVFAAISSDNKLVAIPTEDLDGVAVWDVANNRRLHTLAVGDAKIKLVDHMSFSSDGKQLFVGGENVVVRWDVSTGKALPPLEGNAGYGPPRTFTDSDCKSLITVDDNGMIRRWEPTSGKQFDAPHGYAAYTMTDLSMSRDYVVIADDTGRIDLWTLRDNARHELNPPGTPTTRDVRFSHNGKLLAAGFSDGTIRVWDVATRAELKHFLANPKGESSAVDGLEWSPDGTCLYATTGLNGVLAWDWRGGKLRWQTSTSQATMVRASLDGKLVAALRTDHREILNLNADTGKLQTTARMPADKDRFFAPHCIVFSPDGRTVLAGHYDGLLRSWDVATGKERAAFPSEGDVMWGIDVSRDGRHAVTGSSNGTIRVWELDTGKEVFRRTEPRLSSLRVRFASDGRSVLSAQRRSPILWSVVPRSTSTPEQLWRDLASDPATAYRAQWGLAESDGLAAFLREKLGGKVPASEAKRIEQLVADLNNDSFRKRELANDELVRLGRFAESAVRRVLAKPASAEQTQRLKGLAALYEKGLSAGELRLRRAVQALAWCKDSEATKLLEEWASGMEGAPITESAKTMLIGRKEDD